MQQLEKYKVYRLKNKLSVLKAGELLTHLGNNEFQALDGLKLFLKPEMVEEIKPVSKDVRRSMCDAILDRAMNNDTLFYNLIKLTDAVK